MSKILAETQVRVAAIGLEKLKKKNLDIGTPLILNTKVDV